MDTESSETMPRVTLQADGTEATAFLHGAHVASFLPAGGDEVLFLSRDARFGPGDAIRGGVPVVFPQFAELGPLPKHGFARTAAWALHRRTETEAVLRLAHSDASLAIWPHAFEADLTMSLSAGSLRIELSVENTGDAPMSFTCALHSYLRVADVGRVRIRGLDGVRYRDKVAGGDHVQADEALEISGEVDRMYFGAPEKVVVEDGRRALIVRKEGFPDVVVWNPWIDLARRLPDLADEEYREFVCIEAAHVEAPVIVAPGQRWIGAQTISVRS